MKEQIINEQDQETTQEVVKPAKAHFSFASISPNKKQMIDQLTLKHIKIQQQKELRTWQGLNIEWISRPGINNIIQNKRYAKIQEYLKLEDERWKYFLECLTKFKEIEEDKQQVDLQKNNKSDEKSTSLLKDSSTMVTSLQRFSETMNFKMPKEMQIINRDGITLMTYSKPLGYADQSNHEQLFKMVKADAKLVKAVFECNGFGQTEGNDWNVCWSSQSYKPNVYESLYEYQKVNHFPGSYELTHKAKLISNVVKMQEKFGKDIFNIIPDSYILPDEFADFYNHFHSLRNKEQPNKWIIKPQNSSQGKGIYIIDDISEVPIDESCIISRYVANPFLINGLKFDLRIYVGITCMDPWRIYVYNEGLSRFAVDTYDDSSNKHAHLTNFSLNKKNDKFVNNTNAEQDDMGHKWSIKGLNKHLEAMGIDMNLMWSKIYDVIIKSLICIDGHIQQGIKKLQNKNSCFEILGYDILMDSDLRPWLMEVNLSPSLATESPLDLKIKSGLFLDMLNLISIKKFDRRKDNLIKMKSKVKNALRAKSLQSRQNLPSATLKPHALKGDEQRQKVFANLEEGENGSTLIDIETRNKVIIEKIGMLNNRLREVLKETLIENTRKNNFIRIYPSKGCDMYDKYLQKHLHSMLYKCLFTDQIIPYPIGYPQTNQPDLPFQEQTKVNQSIKNQESKTFQKPHEEVPKLKMKSSQSNLQKEIKTAEINQVKEKLLITGDDVLIEYVHRLMQAVQSLRDNMMKPQWKNQIEKFIKHYVWHTSDARRAQNNTLWQRLESRLIEMKERRKRLLQSIYIKEKTQQQESNLPLLQDSKNKVEDDFLKEFEAKEAYKYVIIQGFSAQQLEEMLKSSTRNVAHEVISCLVDGNSGVLTEIIKLLTTMNRNFVSEEESSFLEGNQRKTHQYGKFYNKNGMKDGDNPFFKGFKIGESEEDTESLETKNSQNIKKKSSLAVSEEQKFRLGSFDQKLVSMVKNERILNKTTLNRDNINFLNQNEKKVNRLKVTTADQQQKNKIVEASYHVHQNALFDEQFQTQKPSYFEIQTDKYYSQKGDNLQDDSRRVNSSEKKTEMRNSSKIISQAGNDVIHNPQSQRDAQSSSTVSNITSLGDIDKRQSPAKLAQQVRRNIILNPSQQSAQQVILRSKNSSSNVMEDKSTVIKIYKR